MSDKNTERPGGETSLFPMFVKLEGRLCLVVGAGSLAKAKICSLLECGATIRVVAPEANADVHDWVNSRQIEWIQKPFAISDLDKAFLVVAATSSHSLNQLIYREARARHVLCNAVDDPENCDFYYPAVVRRGDLQIAISTGGHSPALAQRLRRELESHFGPEYSRWVKQLGEVRRKLFAQNIDPERRRQLLHRLASRASFEIAVTRSGEAHGR